MTTAARIIRSVENNTIDNCLRELPDASLSALHDTKYWALLKAAKKLEEAKKELESAVGEFHAELLNDWSEANIKKAFPAK